MEKPRSLSVKDFLIRKMSIKMLVPEFTLDAVISHQFQAAQQAMMTTKSVEISGFGKFLFNQKKAQKKMEKYISQRELFYKLMNDESVSPQRRNNARLKYETALLSISILKPKLNEFNTNVSGMEEQHISSFTVEGVDSNNIPGENTNM